MQKLVIELCAPTYPIELARPLRFDRFARRLRSFADRAFCPRVAILNFKL